MIAETAAQALRNTGIDPGGELVEGKLTRATCSCKPHKRGKDGNGWYLYYPDKPATLTWGCWNTECQNSEGCRLTAKNEKPLTPAERKIKQSRIEAERKAREDERQRVEQTTREKAARMLKSARDVAVNHPYIVNGGNFRPVGARQVKDMLVIPMSATGIGEPESLQLIFPDGTKRFLTGTGAIPGPLYHAIKGKKGPLYCVEGWKTGCSVHEATGSSVVIAFSSGRLPAVAEVLKGRFPGREIVIAGDQGNGSGKSIEAARKIGGKVVFPAMPDGIEGTDFNDLYQAAGLEEVALQLATAAEPLSIPSQSTTDAPGDAWPEQEQPTADEVASKYFPLSPFPVDILPEYLQSLTKRYAAALQCQFAFMAMAFLTIASGAIGNSVRLAIKSSWKTAPFLWLGIIDKTGAGKSHPLEAAMEPLIRLQAVEAARYEKDMELYKIEEAAYKKNKECEPPQEPEPMRHFYSSNFTVEALIAMYKRTARGYTIFVDELAGLLKGLNQYKGGKGSDDEQFLSLFNCSALKSDRVVKSGFCRESGAAVIGGIQPEVYAGVFGNAEEANGMLYRFLPLVMNAAPPLFSDDELTTADTDAWANIITWLYEIPAETDPETGFIKKSILTVEPAGRLHFREFHDELSRIQPFMPKRFAGYLPKLKTYTLKFTAVLHILECIPLDALVLEVEATTVTNAIKLSRYFAGQALQLIIMQEGTKEPHLAALQKAIESLRGEAVNGKILLSIIRDRMNELLPLDMQIEQGQNKKLSTWLKELGIHTAPGTGNKVYATII